MNWKKAIGLGILLWLIMFAIVSAVMPLYGMLWWRIVLAVIAGIISLIMAGYAKPSGAGKALGYGIVWVIISIILNAAVTLQYNPAFFSDWTMWLSIALIILLPLCRAKKPAVSI